MGTYARVHLADGRELASFRDGVDQLFFVLFTRDEGFKLTGLEALKLLPDSYPGLEVEEMVAVGFRTTVGAILDRLDLLGIDEAAMSEQLECIIEDEIASITQRRRVFATEELEDHYRQAIDALQVLSWETWAEGVRPAANSDKALNAWGGRFEVGSAGWLMSLWESHDERFAFRAILAVLDPNEQIIFNISELDDSWSEEALDPQEFAHNFVVYATQGGLPPIVLTEGTFDAQVLAAAIRIRRPHLVNFLRLPDFSTGVGGGAVELRQNLRALAAAGVPNRVVGLFDNDAAGREAAAPLGKGALPANVTFTFLPDLPLARYYPTIGPQGTSKMNVNGLAGSIEMYLGIDVLSSGGEVAPVEWSNYVKSLRAYQGAVRDKRAIQERWRAKLAMAEDDPSAVEVQDWSGIDLLLDWLIQTIRTIRM